MKKLNINFVSLFRYALLRIVHCNNVTYRDVSLYYSILQCWNKYRFPELLSINQEELLEFSKIGSTNTYRTSLYNLQKNGFIKYYPSRDPSLGSKISICIDKSVLGQNLTYSKVRDDLELSSSLNNSKQEQTYKTPEKKEVINFFIKNKSSEKVAEQFFNLNEALSWKHKDQPILRWKSYAKNYINNNKVKESNKKKVNTNKSSKLFDCGTFKQRNHD